MSQLNFTAEDLKDFAGRNISLEKISFQLENFRSGFPFAELAKPCTLNNGIAVLTSQEKQELEILGREAAEKGRLTKFVPASGAATRMFKDLLAFYHPTDTAEKEKSRAEFEKFFREIKKFAFYSDLEQVLKKNGYDIGKLHASQEYSLILVYLLTPKGLGYAEIPKGLIPFHRYDGVSRTAFEEHLLEAVDYLKDANGKIRIHFTIPAGSDNTIKTFLESVIEKHKGMRLKFEITLSTQKSSTDTIAVDIKNKPFRDAKARLVFRPGGHGALIENLNELSADIVFIRNVDNIAVEHLRKDISSYRSILAGYLVSLQNIIFSSLQELKRGAVSSERLDEMLKRLSSELGWKVIQEIFMVSTEEKRQFLISRLNRPLRVCGMVPNSGEPGGGPFWVRDSKGMLSCQIVESSQVNMNSPEQKRIWESATHFNPVDLVCGLRNYEGKNFNLLDFVNTHAGFISLKSKDGRELKALELPGLWNGAMAGWNTAFVEIPLNTFHPVKTVTDLLKPSHQ